MKKLVLLALLIAPSIALAQPGRLSPQGGTITEVVAGAGLTGGGTSGSVTLNVICGYGLICNADSVVVDNTVFVDGSGTLNYIPLWTPDGNTLGNSIMSQSGTMITVDGALRATGLPSVGFDSLTIGFSSPNGIIAAKNSSGAPASNLYLQTHDGSTQNNVLTLGYDKTARFSGYVRMERPAGTTPLLAWAQAGQTEWQLYQVGSNDLFRLWNSTLSADLTYWLPTGELVHNYDATILGATTLGSSGGTAHTNRLTINGQTISQRTVGAAIDESKTNIFLWDPTSAAAGVGGALTFGGYYNGTSNGTTGGIIKLAKSNATAGNYGYDLIFGARKHGFLVEEGCRLYGDTKILNCVGGFTDNGDPVESAEYATFTPTTVGWYRILDANTHISGRFILYGGYDNKTTNVEIFFTVNGWGATGSLQEVLYSDYNDGVVDQVRISSNAGTGAVHVDVHISSATTPGPLRILGYGPDLPAFVNPIVVGAVADTADIQVLTLGDGFRTTDQIVTGRATRAGKIYFARANDGATTGNLGWLNDTSDEVLMLQNTSGAGEIRINPSSTSGFVTIYSTTGGNVNTERLRVDDTGNVGIVSTTPAGLLSVATTNAYSGVSSPGTGSWDADWSLFGPNVNSVNGAAFGIGYDSTNNASVLVSLAPGVEWKPMWFNAAEYRWWEGGAERMRLDTAGQLGISGVDTVSDPLASLDVRGQIIATVQAGSYAAPINTATNSSTIEANLVANSLITIGDEGTGVADPAVTLYRTTSGFRQGTGLRTVFGGDLVYRIQRGTYNTNYGAESYTDQMTIDSNGYVTFPGTGVQINGCTYFDGAAHRCNNSFNDTDGRLHLQYHYPANGVDVGDNVTDSFINVWGYYYSRRNNAPGLILGDKQAATVAGNGGSIQLEGNYTGTTPTPGALIKTSKYNALDGHYRFDLLLQSRQHLGGLLDTFKITGEGRSMAYTPGLGGQTTAALTDAGDRGGMLWVGNSGTAAGAGGALVFGNGQSEAAGSIGAAAIKLLLSDGGNNTQGSLAIALRTVSTDSALTERVRIKPDGAVTVGTSSSTSGVAGIQVNVAGHVGVYPGGEASNLNGGYKIDGLSVLYRATDDGHLYLRNRYHTNPSGAYHIFIKPDSVGGYVVLQGGANTGESILVDPTQHAIVRAGNMNGLPSSAKGALELFSGRSSSGGTATSLGDSGPQDMAFNFGGSSGGYRHFISTNHNSAQNNGNAMDFWINSGTTAAASTNTSLGTSNVKTLTISGDGLVYAPSKGFGALGGIYSGSTLQQSSDAFSVTLARHNIAFATDDLYGGGGHGCGQTGEWDGCEFGTSVTYTRVFDTSPRGLNEWVGQIQASNTSNGYWWGQWSWFHTTGIPDLRNRTFTFSVWAKSASGTPTLALGVSRYPTDGGGGGTSCSLNSSTWTRCVLTSSFNNTNAADGDNGKAIWTVVVDASTIAVKLWGVQVEESSTATPYVANRDTVYDAASVLGWNNHAGSGKPQTYAAFAENIFAGWSAGNPSVQLGIQGVYTMQDLARGRSLAQIADTFEAGKLRKNAAEYSDYMTSDVSGDYWVEVEYGSTLAYTTTTTTSPRGVSETVAAITCTNGGTACVGGGHDFRYTAHTASHGETDVRGQTWTASAWFRLASGVGYQEVTLALGRYADNDQSNTTCKINSVTWTRCSMTRSFDATNLADNSEIRWYTTFNTTTQVLIYGAQLEKNPYPTDYQRNDGTLATAYAVTDQSVWANEMRVGGTMQNPLWVVGPNGIGPGAGAILDVSFTGTQNDYGPAGLASAQILRVNGSTSPAITGIAAPTVNANGRELWIYNVGAVNLRLHHESASSVAANRLTHTGGYGNFIDLAPTCGIHYRYMTSGAGAGAGTSPRWVQDIISCWHLPGAIFDQQVDFSTTVQLLSSAILYQNPAANAQLYGYTILGNINGFTLDKTINANTDNLDCDTSPTSWTHICRLNVTGSFNLTGLQYGSFTGINGRMMKLYNVGSGTLTLKHDQTSTAANRFIIGSGVDLAMGPNQVVDLVYDTTSARWRVASGAGAAGGGGTGTLNYIPLWTPNGSTLGNSIMSQSGGNIINIATATANGTTSLELQNDARTWRLRVDGGSNDNLTVTDVTGAITYMTFNVSGIINVHRGISLGGGDTDQINSAGAFGVSGTNPSISSCGSSPSVSGEAQSFQVTVGSGTTSCVINFNRTFNAAPYCVFSPASEQAARNIANNVTNGGLPRISSSTTTVTLTFQANTEGTILYNVWCPTRY